MPESLGREISRTECGFATESNPNDSNLAASDSSAAMRSARLTRRKQNQLAEKQSKATEAEAKAKKVEKEVEKISSKVSEAEKNAREAELLAKQAAINAEEAKKKAKNAARELNKLKSRLQRKEKQLASKQKYAKLLKDIAHQSEEVSTPPKISPTTKSRKRKSQPNRDSAGTSSSSDIDPDWLGSDEEFGNAIRKRRRKSRRVSLPETEVIEILSDDTASEVEIVEAVADSVSRNVSLPVTTLGDLGNDTEVAMVGETRGTRALIDFAHGRPQCGIYEFAVGEKAVLFCDNCYCIKCEIPAKNCKQWRRHASLTKTIETAL